MRRIFVLAMLLILAACSDDPQPLIIVATPDAPDAGFRTFDHPSGVFSIRVPPAWIPDQLPDENGLRVQFTAVEGTDRVVRLTVYIVNTGQPLTDEAFTQTVRAYQPPPDIAEVPWTPLSDFAAMQDGSIRLTGLREYPTVGTRALNIFFQSSGSYFAALEVDVTDAAPETIDTLMAAVNTFRVNNAAPLNRGTVSQAGVTAASGVIAFENYLHWEDSNGGFNITGQAVNLTDQAFEAVRLTAYLFDADGNQLAQRSDVLPYDVLGANESAPFRIRFDTGRPTTAVRYEIHAAARLADFTEQTFYGAENFEVVVPSDQSFFNASGFLTVTGLLQNIGSNLAQDIKVTATFFNEDGQVVGTETSFITAEQLLPGESASFEVTFADVGGGPLSFPEVVVQGTIATP